MTISIAVDNEDALVDDVLKIKIEGLKRNENVTIRAEVTESRQVFAGSGCFVADENGSVDLTTHPSTGGTYRGVSAMGLFWSMRPSPEMPKGIRLKKSDASLPLITHIVVYKGHITFEELYSLVPEQLCNKTIRRWYMAKDVQKIRVKSGRVRGTLFLPPGRGPFPGVIDIFGIAGSLMEFRAALLASRGFATLALPYFHYDDLPKVWREVEFDYFMTAVDWFSAHPFVGDVGVLGVSKGGEIALHLGFYNDKVQSVVSINAGPFFSTHPMLYKGVPCIGRAKHHPDRLIETDEGLAVSESLEFQHAVPIWTKDVNVLLISGIDDQCVKTEFVSDLEQRYPSNRKHLCTLFQYPGAGHLIEPPYSPLSRTTMQLLKTSDGKTGKGFMLWGGKTVAHAHAQEDSWKRILNFFRTTLEKTRRTDDVISSNSKL